MIRIAICDDQEIILKQQEKIIQETFAEKGIACQIDVFSSGKHLVDVHDAYDLIFLDIEMPDFTGFEAAEVFKEAEAKALIIFVSSLKDKVFESFRVRGFGFLVKPLEPGALWVVVEDALSELKKKERAYFTFEVSPQKPVQLSLKEILFIETNNRGTKIHTTQKIYDSPMKMADLENKLVDRNFFRIYTSFLVNLEHIRDYNQSEVELTGGVQLQVGRLKYPKFKEHYLRYLKGK